MYKANQIKIIWKYIHLSQSNEHWGGCVHEGRRTDEMKKKKQQKQKKSRGEKGNIQGKMMKC